MLFESEQKTGGGKISKYYIEKNTSILSVVEFVEKHLPEFIEESIGSSKEDDLTDKEDDLTDKLVRVLGLYTHRENQPFRFKNEDPQDSKGGLGPRIGSRKPRVDVGVLSNEEEGIRIGTKNYSVYESFFSFEAKRLYSRLGRAREKEYLVGRRERDKYNDCGGVERFKKCIHGKHLEYSGIIGYVQDEDFEYWHRKINSWIDGLISEQTDTGSKDLITVIWSEDDKLINNRTNAISARYLSINKRKDKEKMINDITLYHLWVKLYKDNS